MNTKTNLNSTLPSPSNDGVDHINIYSNAKTELGRKLSHFPFTPFTHPYFGPFKSMEGFWYWLKAEKKDDVLRNLCGFKAKQYGRGLEKKKLDDFKTGIALFQEDILAANYQKIIQNPSILQMLCDSDLPFQHYYLFGPADLQVNSKGSDWLISGMDAIRTALKENQVPACWTNAEKRYSSQVTDAT